MVLPDVQRAEADDADGGAKAPRVRSEDAGMADDADGGATAPQVPSKDAVTRTMADVRG